MSKTKTSKRKSAHRVPVYQRPWIIIIFFLAMAAAVVLALLFIKPHTDTVDPSTDPKESSSNATPITSPNQTDAPTPESTAEPEKTTQYEGEDPNTLERLTGSLTRKGVDGGILTIVAVVDQYLQSPGYCTIMLKNASGQTVYTASRDAMPDVTASICDAFEIPVSGFASGTYKIEITLSGDGKQGIITDEVAL